MSDGYQVLIPSYKRADRVRGLASFPEAYVVVPESQSAAYSAAGIGSVNLLTIPDHLDGQVGRKYNAVLDLAATMGKTNLLMIDDDVEGVGVWEDGADRKLNAEEIDTLIVQGFRMARQLGAPLWGLNIIKDKRAYSHHRPLKLLAPILGPFTGHCLPHGLRYDEQMGVKQDYDIYLQALARYRRVLRFDKYHYLKRDETVGGASTDRTMDKERAWADAIMSKWGTNVIKYDPRKKNLLDARVTIPIPGC